VSTRTRLVIVDDHDQARSGLCRSLELDASLDIVGEADNGLDALRLIDAHGADVVLIDVVMPALDGLETTRRIKQRWPGVRVVVLTMYEDYRAAALAAGADDFLVKGVPLVEVLNSVLIRRDMT
jgi:DNA-binding NarL/FixJ family response regulator